MARISKITAEHSQPLHDIHATRQLEQRAQATLPAHTLMRRAGLAAAQLTLALAPHARHVWLACGPGNNGGDGFEAALQLHRLGKRVTLTWTGHAQTPADEARQPADARAARARALAAGLGIAEAAPADFDFAIDALLGLGGVLDASRPGTQLMTQWLRAMRSSGVPVLALDVPTGLNADTGASTLAPTGAMAAPAARTSISSTVLADLNALTTLASRPPPGDARSTGNRHTLSLLTLKPGLFTAAGRDEAGQVWLDDLGVTADGVPPCAWLLGADRVSDLPRRPHASHKGSYGDVAVLGGAAGSAADPEAASMVGAALLAARAALHAGAGRVFVALLGEGALAIDPGQPELMFRRPEALDFRQQVLVCGCGGGRAVRAHLPKALSLATRAVFDADALNAIAADPQLQTLLRARQGRGHATVLTPHPLEAARLLQYSASDVQADRLRAAQQLADRFACVVVLKGSGSVIAAPRQTPLINHSGNALLASAGTGDVLAGMVGAALAAGHPAWTAASRAVFLHGRVADCWTAQGSERLTASTLAGRASV